MYHEQHPSYILPIDLKNIQICETEYECNIHIVQKLLLLKGLPKKYGLYFKVKKFLRYSTNWNSTTWKVLATIETRTWTNHSEQCDACSFSVDQKWGVASTSMAPTLWQVEDYHWPLVCGEKRNTYRMGHYRNCFFRIVWLTEPFILVPRAVVQCYIWFVILHRTHHWNDAFLVH